MLRRVTSRCGYCTSRRDRMKALKKEELKRPRSYQSTSPTVNAAIKLGATGETLASKGLMDRIRKVQKVGMASWIHQIWNGHRSRGGGLRSWLVSVVRVFSIISFTILPVWYFLHDDGRATVLTRFAVCEQLYQVKDARVLDVGTGNGELSKMVAIEVGENNGTVTTIDSDSAIQEFNKVRFKNLGYQNLTAINMDVFDLKDSLEGPFTHCVISMCLHELDQNRRFSCLENTSLKTQGGTLIILDFTPSASGFSNLSQARNSFMEWTTDHNCHFKDWISKGGLPPLIDEMEVQRKEGTLKIPPLKIARVEEEDRGTHAVYVVEVGKLA